MSTPSPEHEVSSSPLRGVLLRAGVPLLLLLFLARVVVRPEPPGWDLLLMEWLHRHLSGSLERGMVRVTDLGTWMAVIPISIGLGGWLAWKSRWRELSFFSASMLGAWALEEMVKGLYHRSRPSLWAAADPTRWYGFPSGHAMGTTALALAASLLAWEGRARWWVVTAGAGLVLLVSLSRVSLGLHYPSDVLGAWLAAATWVLLLQTLLLPRGHR